MEYGMEYGYGYGIYIDWKFDKHFFMESTYFTKHHFTFI